MTWAWRASCRAAAGPSTTQGRNRRSPGLRFRFAAADRWLGEECGTSAEPVGTLGRTGGGHRWEYRANQARTPGRIGGDTGTEQAPG
jgi:hypothetical protein